jgi:predicted dehydrogenase
MVNDQIKIGIVGAAGLRASAFRHGIESTGKAHISCLCDTDAERLKELAEQWGKEIKVYTDYETMLEKGKPDAVIICTPVSLHAEQAIKALERGIHVYSEVPAAVTFEECQALVAAAKASKSSYVLGENMIYMRDFLVVENMILGGLLGDIFYMQGEYLHNVKDLFEISPWRKQFLAGINGVNYGTHCLAPMLLWMKGDRINRLLCTGTGRHFMDPANGKPFEQEDGCLMICKTEKGRSIDIRVELLTERPYSLNFRVQGTDGIYEVLHGWTEETSRYWSSKLFDGGDKEKWMDFEELKEQYLPDIWRDIPQSVLKETHWGVDYVTIREYIASLLGERPFRVGIHEAMDLTLPGILSTESINSGGIWINVPDTRSW